LKVLVVEPYYAPYEKEINGLHEMQAVVGGLIQPIYPYEEKVSVVCNEEGLINGLPFNRSVEGGYGGVFGTFFVCGLSGENFSSLTPEQMERFKKRFHNAEILIGAQGNTPITLTVPPNERTHPTKAKDRDTPPSRG